MDSIKRNILIINCGSSSIKFALYAIDGDIRQLLSGSIVGLYTANAQFNFKNFITSEKKQVAINARSPEEAFGFLTDWLAKQEFGAVTAIGHRVVHGMGHKEPELITPELLQELKNLIPYDPDHLPVEIEWIECLGKKYPSLPQIVCFDTAFHACMPTVAKLLPIPRRYYTEGIQRYGFHGISYAYLMDELERCSGTEAARGKIILAHLGSGASIAAVKEGKSSDTSMGFTPASGLMMGTRTGDLDPGVARYLMQAEKLDPGQFNDLVNHDSGLLGISETSADMQELLKIQKTDFRAAEAVELFCYQAKKWIGSFSAVLGGLDTLVFAGGIGENAPEVRTRICSCMEFLGIELDESKNLNNEAIISSGSSRVCVRVIKTNEELIMVKMVCRILNYNTNCNFQKTYEKINV